MLFRSDELFRTGHSKVQWPKSKHNIASTHQDELDAEHAGTKLPNLSHAVDVSPYPIIWENRKRFDHFAGIVRAVAHQLEIPIRWGGAWGEHWWRHDTVGLKEPQSFDDLVHYELGVYE